MPIRILATAAVAVGLVLFAPAAAFADVSHDSSLEQNVAAVTVDTETEHAGQEASVVVLRAGAHYSDPEPADVVYLNQYTLDENGRLSFQAALPGGELDDYVLAVHVAGETERYLASLDPEGPTPVDPPPTDPPATDPPATDPPATDPPATDPPATDPPATDVPGSDPPTGGGEGNSGSDEASGSSDGPLALTGATIATGAIAGALALLLVGTFVLVVRRRRAH